MPKCRLVSETETDQRRFRLTDEIGGADIPLRYPLARRRGPGGRRIALRRSNKRDPACLAAFAVRLQPDFHV
jgi:hypothetical protein